ncbi:Sorting nexin-2, partial [Galemys pyrenaicus]
MRVKMVAKKETPPLEYRKPINSEELDDIQDLFTITIFILELGLSSPEPPSFLAKDINTNSNSLKPAEVLLDDNTEDLFVEDRIMSMTSTMLIAPRIESKEIGVSDSEKVGSGMNAYMACRVTTKTSLSILSKCEFSSKRKFSNFLVLHSKLASKYLHVSYIVPPAQKKSILGITRVNVSKADSSSSETSNFADLSRKILTKCETEAKMVVASKPDKIQPAKNERREWNTKIQKRERDFEQTSQLRK